MNEIETIRKEIEYINRQIQELQLSDKLTAKDAKYIIDNLSEIEKQSRNLTELIHEKIDCLRHELKEEIADRIKLLEEKRDAMLNSRLLEIDKERRKRIKAIIISIITTGLAFLLGVYKEFLKKVFGW